MEKGCRPAIVACLRRLASSMLAAFVIMSSAGLAAAVTSPEAEKKSDSIQAQIKQLEAAGDFAGAAAAAAEASRVFSAEGERYLAASYALMKTQYIANSGNWQQVHDELYPRVDQLLSDLDKEDANRADTLLMFLMDTEGILGDRVLQDRFASHWLSRVRGRYGDLSQEDIQARIHAAQSFVQSGATDEGYDRWKKALAASALTGHDALTISSYTMAGRHYMQLNQLDHAEELFKAALASRAAASDTVDLPSLMAFYASMKSDTGRFAEAMKDFQRAEAIAERMGGKGTEVYLLVRDEHATALARNGFPASSTTMMGENYRLALKTFGPDFNWTWKTANNYADQLRQIGAPEQASELDAFLLEKRADYYGEHHLNVYVSANNMAQNQLALGRFDEARKFLQQQEKIGIALDQSQPGHDYAAQARAWLSLGDAMSGKLAQTDALKQIEEIVPSDRFAPLLRVYAASFAADEYEKAKDWPKVLTARNHALAISMMTDGPVHPQTFDLRLKIARAKTNFDAKAAALDFGHLDSDMRKWMSREVASAGDRAVAEATRALADDMLYEYGKLASTQPDALSGFARAVHGWKSLNEEAQNRYLSIVSTADGTDAEAAGLARTAMRLSGVLNEMRSSSGSTEWSQTIADRLAATDASLNQRLSSLKDFIPATLPAVEGTLGDREALVTYVVTRKWGPDRRATNPFVDVTLYALVFRKGQVKLVALGDPRSIQANGGEYRIASLRTERPKRGAASLIDLEQTANELYERLVRPIDPSLQEVETLYVVPDGVLFAVPFSLLRDDQGRLLEDRFTLRFLTRPDALLNVRSVDHLENGTSAVLVGGLDYANGAEKGAEPLPGTKQEVEEIAALLKRQGSRVQSISGAAATESVVRKSMESSRIAHLATHGAYESEGTGGASGVDTLWQSGIILSRSGDRKTMSRDVSDGRLYAYELLEWDLSGLDLLVLSACETGRGDESFISGLRGLPTAISIAGAKRSLLALWPVDDQGTEQFMVRFYEHLVGGKTYPEALRQTRKDAIAGKLPAAKDPRVWAAFVMFEN